MVTDLFACEPSAASTPDHEQDSPGAQPAALAGTDPLSPPPPLPPPHEQPPLQDEATLQVKGVVQAALAADETRTKSDPPVSSVQADSAEPQTPEGWSPSSVPEPYTIKQFLADFQDLKVKRHAQL